MELSVYWLDARKSDDNSKKNFYKDVFTRNMECEKQEARGEKALSWMLLELMNLELRAHLDYSNVVERVF